MTRSPFPSISVWALGLLLAACGGGGDDTDGDPPPDEGTPPPVVATYKQQVLGLLEDSFLVSCRPNLSTPDTDRTLSVNDAGVLTLSGKDPIDFNRADAVLSVSRTVVSGTAPAGVALLGGQGELSIGMTLVPAGTSNYQIDAAYHQDDRVPEVQSCAPRGPQPLAQGWRGDEVLRALLSDESGTMTCASSTLGVLPAIYTYSLNGGVLSLFSSGSNQQFNLVGGKQDELFQLPADPRNPTAAPADSLAYSVTLSTGATIALEKSQGGALSAIEVQGAGSNAVLTCSR